jgi:hypothetical protein
MRFLGHLCKHPYRRQTSARAWEGIEARKPIDDRILALGNPECLRAHFPSCGPGSGFLL